MTTSLVTTTSRRFPGVLATILLVAAFVRLRVIGRDALWLDEGYSWWDAEQSFKALWQLVPNCDPHPPLYFALLHGWIGLLGDSTVVMRSLSTVFGLATICVVYAAGRTLDIARGEGKQRFGIGAFAALLFALTPFEIYFSIEARPYALLCFGAALLTLGCLRVIAVVQFESRRLASRWMHRIDAATVACLLIGGVIVVWTNNTAVLMLAAATVGFALLWSIDRGSRATIGPVVAIGVLVGLFWSPDWPLLLQQGKEVTQDFWIPRPSVAGVTYELHYLIGLDAFRLTWPLVFVVACGLSGIGLSIGKRWLVMLGALAVLPIVFNIAISAVLAPIFISRALIGAAPALTIGLAAAAVLPRSRMVRAIMVMGLLIVHVYAVAGFLSADHVKEPWKPIIAKLAVIAKDSPILVVPNELVLPLEHEAKMQHVELHVHGLPADYPATDMQARYPSGKCAPSVIDQDLKPLLDSLRDDEAVVFLTRLNNTYDPRQDVAAALKSAGFMIASDDVFQPGDLRVIRFARPAH